MMRISALYFTLLVSFTEILRGGSEAAQTGPMLRYFSHFLKWTRSSPKIPQTDENAVRFENGYVIETVVEGTKLGFEPYSLRVSPEGELFAVDSVNSKVVRFTPPLSPYSRARLVAGSSDGYTGHVDGKPSDARFYHPKGITMDDTGNVYIADTSNLAIRKVGEAGVTTIAGGKSGALGFMDGPSEDAKFSNDFDVVYLRHTCSLLIVDRGNAALRQIYLQPENCGAQTSSISVADILAVAGAVLVGYGMCMFHRGFGFSSARKKKVEEYKLEEEHSYEKLTTKVETIKEETPPEWPSPGQLILDLIKLAFEALWNFLFSFILRKHSTDKPKKGQASPRDSFVMPQNVAEPSTLQSNRVTFSQDEVEHFLSTPISCAQQKREKIKSGSVKEPCAFPAKQRSSMSQDSSELYRLDGTQYNQSSKTQKERRRRFRDKSSEIVASSMEGSKSGLRAMGYVDHMTDGYSTRKFVPERYP